MRRGLIVSLREVPLVHDDNEAASSLPRQRGNFEILILELPLGRLDEQQADVGPLDGAPRTQRGVELDAIFYPTLPPQARGIDEHEVTTVIPHRCVDRVARRTGNL